MASLAAGPFEAANMLRQAAIRDPEGQEVPVHQSLAAALHLSGQIDEAAAVLTRLLEPAKRASSAMPAPPLGAEDVLRLADCQEKAFALDAANSTLYRLIIAAEEETVAPQVRAIAATKLSFLRHAQGDDAPAALMLAKLATRLDPKSADAQVALGLALDAAAVRSLAPRRRKQHLQLQAEAEEAFAAAVANRPDPTNSLRSMAAAAPAVSPGALALAADMMLASRRPFARAAIRMAGRDAQAAGGGRPSGGWAGAAGATAGPASSTAGAGDEGTRDREHYAAGVKCNIERREFSSVTEKQLQTGYIDQGKPLILQQSVRHDANADADASDGDGDGAFAAPRWNRQELLKHYGHLPVDVLRSSDIVADQRWRAQGLQRNITMSLREFIETAMGGDDDDINDVSDAVPDADLLHNSAARQQAGNSSARRSRESLDPLYIFSSRSLEGIAGDLRPPRLFEPKSPWIAERFEWDDSRRLSHALFYLGPSGSGTWFHQHYDGA